MRDSKEYLAKKEFTDKLLTIYGRNSVYEALCDDSLSIYKLHLSKSNRPANILDQIVSLASSRGIDIAYHDKASLSRISKNAKQDQGVALDIIMPFSADVQNFTSSADSYRIIALDGIHNPQNLGMIIRSCAAGAIDAILIPQKGTAQISPLVIKASAGTLFKIPILKTKELRKSLKAIKDNGGVIYRLSSDAKYDYRSEEYPTRSVFVLGNESTGVSKEIEKICDKSIAIPMQRGVESLNVAVTAALLAFM